MITAKIDGTYDYGNCGIVPLVRVPMPKPKLRNNGYCEFNGCPTLHVPGLSAAFPTPGYTNSGHVMLVFSDDKTFGTFASRQPGDIYRFS